MNIIVFTDLGPKLSKVAKTVLFTALCDFFQRSSSHFHRRFIAVAPNSPKNQFFASFLRNTEKQNHLLDFWRVIVVQWRDLGLNRVFEDARIGSDWLGCLRTWLGLARIGSDWLGLALLVRICSLVRIPSTAFSQFGVLR